MNDSEIEEFLQSYRPVGPPAELLDRILATTRMQPIWPWASAAAALWISALALSVAGGYETARADLTLGPSAIVRVTEDLTDMHGGLGARELAEFMVIEQQIRGETSSAAVEAVAGPGALRR